MRIGDVSPSWLYASGVALGLAGGVAASVLADTLPRRYDITHPAHLASGAKRRRRNVAVTILALGCALGLAHTLASHPDASLGRAAFYFFTNFVLAVGVVAGAAVDVEHMILPNEVTLGGAAFALATAYFRGVGLGGSFAGAAIGFAASYLPHLLYKRLRGRSGQGLGDTKLAIMAGAWQGPEGAIFVLFAGALQSALAALLMRAFRLSYPVPESVLAEIRELRAKAESGGPDAAEAKELLEDDPMAHEAGGESGEAGESGDGLLTTRLPLGPFLAAACLEFLFEGRAILGFLTR